VPCVPPPQGGIGAPVRQEIQAPLVGSRREVDL
jgi:hypothetical protein